MNRLTLTFFLAFSISFSTKLQSQSTLQQNDEVFQRCQKIIFNDDLSKSKVGSADSNWELLQGNQLVKMMEGQKAICFEGSGNFLLKPMSLPGNYLEFEFTIQFDLYCVPGSFGQGVDSTLNIQFKNSVNKTPGTLQVANSFLAYYYPMTKHWHTGGDHEHVFFTNPNKNSHWDHIAISYSERHLKVYVDYMLYMDITNTDMDPENFEISGKCSTIHPVTVKNFTVRKHELSGEMKQLLTEGKLTTYAITFDTNSPAIQSESLHFISDVADLLEKNPNIKIEIDGYTANSGSLQYNLDFSSRRAEAVKMQLVSSGISAARIVTKGLGESNPVGDNNTEEGKAKNRRIEFVVVK